MLGNLKQTYEVHRFDLYGKKAQQITSCIIYIKKFERYII